MSEVAWIASVAAVAAALSFESRFFARGREPRRRESISLEPWLGRARAQPAPPIRALGLTPSPRR
jgi:hypothetical protein